MQLNRLLWASGSLKQSKADDTRVKAEAGMPIAGLQMIRAKYDSRKLTGRFAQQGMICAILWMFRASKLLCHVSFTLRFNYFIYLIYQLFVWVLLVADVNLGSMHLSTK